MIKDNKKIQPYRILQPIPIKDSDLYVRVNIGTSLVNLATKYYNDSTKWRILAKANNMDSPFTKDSMLIRIPDSPEIKYVKD
jgi:hypothetical protein